MPNHCDTDITISGPNEILDKILKLHITENGELNCDSVIPYPEKFKLLDEVARKWAKENEGKTNVDWTARPRDGFNQGGYEWCCNNWGTKWGTYDGDGVERRARSFSLRFNSAWAPPTPVINKLAEMYPEVRISMDSYECGAAYQVHSRWENGVCVSEVEEKYHGTRGG